MTFEEIRKICEAAPEGPWEITLEGGVRWPRQPFAVAPDEVIDTILNRNDEANKAAANQRYACAAFCVMARTMLPKLLELAEEWEKLMEQHSCVIALSVGLEPLRPLTRAYKAVREALE